MTDATQSQSQSPPQPRHEPTTAAVIAVGDELVCGYRLDTNSQWLAQALSDCGLDVRFHVAIGDSLEDYLAALETVCARSPWVVLTGGLGPTDDDLTRQAVARFAGVELTFDEESWRRIQQLFARRKRPMPEKNRLQAFFPAGSRILPNAHGTAPGFDLTLATGAGRHCRLVALPGVPAEMKEMWEASVEPSIRAATRRAPRQHWAVHCFGAGESEIEQMIPAELMRRGRDPLVGITASDATITLRVSTIAVSAEAARRRMEPTVAAIRQALGHLVFGEQHETLQEVLAVQLQARRQTLGIADLGLAGLPCQWLMHAGPEPRTHVVGGLEAVELEAARRLLHLPQALSGDDPAAIESLADEIRGALGASLGLAIGPITAAADPPLSRFTVAWSDGARCVSDQLTFGGHPSHRIPRAVKQVLNFARQRLMGP